VARGSVVARCREHSRIIPGGGQQRSLQTCRSALVSGERRAPFCRLVRCSVGDARSPIRGVLTSLATPSPCGLWRTLCAPGKPIRQPCCSLGFHAPATARVGHPGSNWTIVARHPCPTPCRPLPSALDERRPGYIELRPWVSRQVTGNVDEDVTSPDQPMSVTGPVLAPGGTVTTSFFAVSETMEA